VRKGDAEMLSADDDAPPTRRRASDTLGARSSERLAACCCRAMLDPDTCVQRSAHLVRNRESEALELGAHLRVVLPELLDASVGSPCVSACARGRNGQDGRTTAPSPVSRLSPPDAPSRHSPRRCAASPRARPRSALAGLRQPRVAPREPTRLTEERRGRVASA
jgi:hypothetical protein